MLEWINHNCHRPEDEVRTIADDKTRPIFERGAAKALLGMLKDGWFKGRREGADDFDRIMDRTVGKPMQSLLVQHTQSDDPEVLLAELRAAITRSPELLSILGDRLPAEALPAADDAGDSAA
ncbi:MAG: hypothetical protein V3T84_14635 [Phycisphaerales bacterium]